jgi:hypothetical protein
VPRVLCFVSSDGGSQYNILVVSSHLLDTKKYAIFLRFLIDAGHNLISDIRNDLEQQSHPVHIVICESNCVYRISCSFVKYFYRGVDDLA